jgi:hypothetical protein
MCNVDAIRHFIEGEALQNAVSHYSAAPFVSAPSDHRIVEIARA